MKRVLLAQNAFVGRDDCRNLLEGRLSTNELSAVLHYRHGTLFMHPYKTVTP